MPNVDISKIREYTGHKGSIFSMLLSEDESALYSGADDGFVAKWDLKGDGNHATAILQTDRGIYAMELLPDNRLAIGTSNGIIYFVDLTTNSVIKTLQQNEASIYGLKLIGDHLWVLHAGGWLTILALNEFKRVHVHRIAENHLRSIALLTEQKQVLIGSSDSMVNIIDLQTLKVVKKWQAHQNSVFSLAIHQEGKYILSGGRDAYLNVWDIKDDFKQIKDLPGT